MLMQLFSLLLTCHALVFGVEGGACGETSTRRRGWRIEGRRVRIPAETLSVLGRGIGGLLNCSSCVAQLVGLLLTFKGTLHRMILSIRMYPGNCFVIHAVSSKGIV